MTTQIRRRRSRRHTFCWVASVALLVAACGDDDEAATSSASASTSAPSTIASSTTATPTTTATTPPPAATTTAAPTSTAAPVTTAPATTSPTTTAPVVNGFDPPCVERPASDDSLPDTPEPTELGPLALEPGLTVQLPVVRVDGVAESPIADVEPVGGRGVLISVRSDSTETSAQSMVALVGVDGAVRWVRCFDSPVYGTYAGSGGSALLLLDEWTTIDLESGETAPAGLFDDPTEWSRFPVGETDDVLLFAPPEERVIEPSRHRLLLASADGDPAPVPIAFPPAAAGSEMFRLRFEFADVQGGGDEERQLVMLDDSLPPAVVAVFAEDVWTSDPDVLADAIGPRAGFVFGDERFVLTGYDAFGQVTWTNEEVSPRSTEGFQSATSDGVLVIAGCFDPVEEGLCDASEVGGVEIATGDVLWRLPGNRAVAVVGDGYALVTDGTDAGGWTMIDTATGAQIDEQEWTDPATFEQRCCGEGDFVWVDREGGIVIATSGEHVAVYYRADAGVGPHTVTLP